MRRLYRAFVPALALVSLAYPARAGEVVKLPSGLEYEVLTRGTGTEKAALGDTVRVHYTGTLIDGTKFDSSRDGGEPAEFRLVPGGLIAGWIQALPLMSVGDRFKFTVPPDLGYGPQGSPPLIGPNAVLVFDIELVSITPGLHAPAFERPNADKVKRTESGIAYEVVADGAGDPPTPKDTFELRFTYWSTDGQLIESSAFTGQGLRASTEQLNHKFLKEIPLLMKPGSRFRCEVPASLLFGENARPGLPANSATIWDIELASVQKALPAPDFVMPKDDELTVTASGLKYQIVKEGSGESPNMGQEVEVHYAGWLTDGTAFDASFTRGATAKFRLGNVIQGWNEGLQLMKPGGSARFVIPPDLAYGDKQRGPIIKPNSTLVFYVELIAVK